VVIGVHTPEFAFEHNIENVRQAAQDMRVAYPLTIDNGYALWRAFKNHYGPALSVVDAQGQFRHHHFGEGAYVQSERIIQHLLASAAAGIRWWRSRPVVRKRRNHWALRGAWTMGKQAAVLHQANGRESRARFLEGRGHSGYDDRGTWGQRKPIFSIC
jgi:hypothetical protein